MSLSGVTTIMKNAFRGCTNLTTINLEDVVTIGQDAFNGCGLTSVNLSRATSIAGGAFCNCKSLTTITSLGASSGLTIGGSAFDGCSSLGSVDVSNVTNIGGSAFKDCTSLTTVTGSGKASMAIGGNAFEGCSSLTRADVASAVSIGNSAFKDCTSLDSVDIRSAITFGTAPFDGCTSLRSAVMSPSFDTGSISTVFSGSSLENPEAYVDGNGYRTLYRDLKDAIESASSGDSVVLLKDVDLGDSPITIDKSLSLDLSGYSVRADTGPVITVSSGTVSIGGNGRVESTSGYAVLNLAGDLTIVNGTFSTSSGKAFGSSFEAQFFNYVGPVGNTTIDGGTFVDGDGGRTIGVNGSIRSATGDIRKKPEVSLDPPLNLSPFVWSSVQSDGYQHLVRGVYFVFNVYDGVSFTAGEGLAELSLQKSGAYSTGTVAVERGSVVTFTAVPQEGYGNVEVTGATYTKTDDVYSVVVDPSDLYTTITLDAEKVNKVVFSHGNDVVITLGTDLEWTGTDTVILSDRAVLSFTLDTVSHSGRLVLSSSEFYPQEKTVSPVDEESFVVNSSGTIEIRTQYMIAIADGIEHGTVTADGKLEGDGYWYDHSARYTLTFTPEEGYELAGFSIRWGSGNTRTFEGDRTTFSQTMPDANFTVSAASFVPKTYTISYYVDDVLWKTDDCKYGSDIVPISYNGLQKGMQISSWQGLPAKMPAENISVYATTSWVYYDVTFGLSHVSITSLTVDGKPATISDGKISAHCGQALEFTLAADEGYEIVSVSGAQGTGEGPYTNKMDDAPMGITASAAPINYAIKKVSDHGTISIPEEAHFEDTVTFTVTAGTGWSPDEVTVTAGVTEIACTSENGTYSFSMPSSDVVVTATYKQIEYALVYYVDGQKVHEVSYHYEDSIASYTYSQEGKEDISEWPGLPEKMPAKDLDVYAQSKVLVLHVSITAGENTHFVHDGKTYVHSDGEQVFEVKYGDSIVFSVYGDTGYDRGLKVGMNGAEGTAVLSGTGYNHKVNEDLTFVLSTEPNVYKVEWYYDSKTLLETTYVEYGMVPVYPGKDPEKESDAQFDWTFTAWVDVNGETPTAITGDIEYYAEFVGKTRTYEVEWLQDDGSLIRKDDVKYGELPAFGDEGPEKEGDVQYTYHFSGWDHQIEMVKGPQIYKATYRSEVNKYWVTWLDEDGTEISKEEVEYGTIPAEPGIEEVKQTVAETMTFTGWDHEISKVEGDQTYKAVYKHDARMYSVTFSPSTHATFTEISGVTDGKAPYGSDITFKVDVARGYEDALLVKIDGEKATADESGTYKIEGIASDIVVEADTEANEYHVVFDERWIAVYRGTTPLTNGALIHHDEEITVYAKERTGYDSDLSASVGEIGTDGIYTVSGDVTFSVEHTAKIYTITWLDGDDNILSKDEVAYDVVPSYSGKTPTKDGGKEFVYTFNGTWSPTPAADRKDATYRAQFDQVVRSYTVTWKNWDGTVLATDSVDYGKTPQYNGETPEKEGDAECAYSFIGWSTNGKDPVVLSKVEGDVAYTAVFEQKTRTYTVTWKNWDGTTLREDEFVPYGTVPEYADEEPEKVLEDDPYTYRFTCWSPQIAEITRDTVYTAQFEGTLKTFQVTWEDWDGTVLDVRTVSYGTSPEYMGKVTPFRGPEGRTAYVFAGWQADGVPIGDSFEVTSETVLTAFYKETERTYTVTWTNWDGSLLHTDEGLAFGVVPVYDGPEPVRPAEGHTLFLFAGWDPEPGAVDDDVTYKAVFDASTETCPIVFEAGEGTSMTVTGIGAGAIAIDPGSSRSVDVPIGTEVTVAVDALRGYVAPTVIRIGSFDYDLIGGSYTFEAASSVRVVSSTERAAYDIDIQEAEHTYVVLMYMYSAGYEDALSFMVHTDDGYSEHLKVYFDGVPVAPGSIGVYSVTMPDHDVVLRTETSASTYTVRFIVEEHTNLRFDGESDVRTAVSFERTYSHGEKLAFHCYADEGYGDAFTVNGVRPISGAYSEEVEKSMELILHTEPNRYEIVWQDEDGTELYRDSAALYGTMPVYKGPVPEKAGGPSVSYDFAGWSPAESRIAGDAVYTAQYDEVPTICTVTWKDWDGAVIATDRLVYGTFPEYGRAEPVRDPDAEHEYRFSGWSPSPSAVTDDTEYTAVYAETDRMYTVTWRDWDGSVLSTEELPYGGKPTYDGAPARASDERNDYEFSGWSPEVVDVVRDAVYTAEYARADRLYSVEFSDPEHADFVCASGQSFTARYGDTVAFTVDAAGYVDSLTVKMGWTGATSGSETLMPDDSGSYSFTVRGDTVVAATTDLNTYMVHIIGEGVTVMNGTSHVTDGGYVHHGDVLTVTIAPKEGHTAEVVPSVGTIGTGGTYAAEADVTFTGKYTPIRHTVTWLAEDGSVIRTDSVPYGEVPAVPVPPAKASDTSATYAFAGWSPSVAAVTGDAEYTATYTPTPRTYTVRWTNDDGTLLYSSSVAYGTVPEFAGDPPRKEQDAQSRYEWTGGWTPEVAPVTGDATYTAVFTAVDRTYTVTWRDWNGDVIGTDTVVYGDEPAYGGDAPSREGASGTRYVFLGWTPAVVRAVGDATYTAVYTTQYALTLTAGENASFTDINGSSEEVAGGSSAAIWYDAGTTARFRAVASDGYAVAVDGADALMGDGLYRVEMASPRTVSASASPMSYTVAFVPSEHAWFVVDGSEVRTPTTMTAVFGQTIAYTVHADDRHTSALFLDGVHVESGSGHELVVDGDTVVRASVSLRSYTVAYDPEEVSVTIDGISLPSGSSVESGTAVDVRVLPIEGYEVGLMANGAATAEGEYRVVSDVTFVRSASPIAAERTIVFPTEGGTVSEVTVDGVPAEPEGGRLTVPDGSTVSFVVEPEKGDGGKRVVVTDGSGSRTIEPDDGRYTIVVDTDITISIVTEPSGQGPYVIIWSNWDGTVLGLGPAEEGEVPVYRGAVPVRPDDEHARYTFAGWTPEVGPAHGNVNYLAVYDVELDTFTVTWKDWNGAVLATDTVAYGSVPEYQGSTPARSGYSFSGWSPSVAAVTGDAEYTAVYAALPVETCKVVIRGDGVTVMNGSAQVRSGSSVPAGTLLTVTMEQRDGYEAVLTASVGSVASDGSYTVSADVVFTGSYSPIDDGGDDDDDGFPWWILLLLLAIIVAAYLVYRRYRNGGRD